MNKIIIDRILSGNSLDDEEEEVKMLKKKY